MNSKPSKTDILLGFFDRGIYSCTKDGKIFNAFGVEMKPYKNKNGYWSLRFQQKNKKYSWYVHRIVWLYFTGRLTPGKVIHHLDGNKENNTLNNLREISQTRNLELARNVFGIGTQKLTLKQVIKIKENYSGKRGEITRMALSLGVSRVCVSMIVNGKSWRNL